MHKKIIYPTVISLFVIAIVVVFARFIANQQRVASYKLNERKGTLPETGEYIRTRATAAKLKMAIQENPGDKKSMLALAALYIQEARITGNYRYYDMAAMQQVNNILRKDPDNFEALTYKALIFLSQHHFADGLSMAEKAKSINPYNAFIYGILVDANVEMGEYKKAVEYSDSMVSIRPDIRSYSRVSYLREVHGDYPGAIEAMKMALDAGMPGEESTEWVRVQLGLLYEKTGDLKNAEMHYTIALEERPYYAYALAGLGRIAGANKEYRRAIICLLKADSLVNDYGFKDELSDMYKLAGQKGKALSVAQNVIAEINSDAKSGLTEENIGHYADRELAYGYLKVNDNDQALTHALAEYNRRPKNIDVNETVAWVYYNQDKPVKALPYLEEALKTNSKNPTLLGRAGLIYAKAGDKEKAEIYLGQVRNSHANISEDLKTEVIQALQSL